MMGRFTYTGFTLHFKLQEWLDHRKHMNHRYTDLNEYATQKHVTVRVGPFYWVRHYMDIERSKRIY